MIEKQVSKLMLERYHLGEVTDEERKLVENALASDLCLRLEGFENSDRELRRLHPLESLPALAGLRDAVVPVSTADRSSQKGLRRPGFSHGFSQLRRKKLLRGICVAAALLCVLLPVFVMKIIPGKTKPAESVALPLLSDNPPTTYVSEGGSPETGSTEPYIYDGYNGYDESVSAHAVSAGDSTFNPDYFKFSGTLTLTLILYSGPGGELTIPAEMDGKPVTAVGENAFRNKNITVAIIPDSVIYIGNYAFGNNQLTSIVIPDSVTSIGKGAFAGNHLAGVVIPDSVTSIGEGAFAGNRLASVTISGDITSIGERAFAGNRLTVIVIPDGVVSIGKEAFADNRLTRVTISASVTSIGERAFADNLLTVIVIPNSVVSIGDYAFEKNQLVNITMPDGIISISKGLFAQNKLTGLVIPDSVIYIEEMAFANNRLSYVTIPDSVTYIGGYAFRNNQLTRITIGANVIFHSSEPFGNGFEEIYNNNRTAGIYTRPSPTAGGWSI